MRGLGWLVVLLLTSGMTCGPQREPVEMPPVPPPQQTVMHFPSSMDGINTLLCFEDEQPVEACVELRTLRRFVRGMRLVEYEIPGAGAAVRHAADILAAPTPPPAGYVK